MERSDQRNYKLYHFLMTFRLFFILYSQMLIPYHNKITNIYNYEDVSVSNSLPFASYFIPFCSSYISHKWCACISMNLRPEIFLTNIRNSFDLVCIYNIEGWMIYNNLWGGFKCTICQFLELESIIQVII